MLSSLDLSSPDLFAVVRLVPVFLGMAGKASAGGFGCLKVCLAALNALFFWSRLMDVGLDILDTVHRIAAGLLLSVCRDGFMGQWERQNVALRW